MVVHQDIRRLEVSVANLGELHVVKRFEHLKYNEFSDFRMKRFFNFSLFLDHNVETGRDKLHNDTEITFLSICITTSLTNFKKYSFIVTILQ